MDTRVPDGHRRTDRNIDRCLRRRRLLYKISFILISRRARRIRTKKTDRISSGTWKNDYVKRAAMETREEKQQGCLITRKEKNKLSWQTIALPHIVHHALRTHTHDLQHSYTTLSMTRKRVRGKRAKSTPFIKCLQTGNISLLNNSQKSAEVPLLFSVWMFCCCVRVVVLKINSVVWRQAGLGRLHLENFQMFSLFGAFSFILFIFAYK